MGKKVVFVRPDGLHQIRGDLGNFPRTPITAEGFEAFGETIAFASLYRETTRAAYYRAPIVPASYTFHEAQR